MKPLQATLIGLIIFFNACLHGQHKDLIIRQGHSAAINEIIYSPDGNYIFSASDDKTIKMWDVKSGIDIKSFNGHTHPVKCIAITSSGNKIISGDADGKIIVWDVNNKDEPIHFIQGHEGAVNTIEVYENNLFFLSGGKDEIIKKWDINTGKPEKSIEAATSEIRAISIHPNQQTAVVGGQKTNDVELIIVDLENGNKTDDILNYYKNSGLTKAYIYGVLSGFSIATNIAKGNIGKDMLDFFIIDYSNIAFMKDGKTVLISQNMYMPMAAAKDEEEETGNSTVSLVNISPDGKKFVNPKKPKRWMIAYSNARAVFNDDQTKIILNKKYSINVYDMEKAEFPDGKLKEVQGYEPPLVKEFKGGSVAWLNSIAMSPDYKTAASSDDQHSIKLWDMETGRIFRKLEGFVRPALSVDAMPDGKHILVGSERKNMTMWDITTGRLVREFDRSPTINQIDISNNGKYIATTSPGTSFFKVWNFKSGRLLKSILEKNKEFTWVKFSGNPNEIYAKYKSTDDAGIGMSMLKSDDDVRLYDRKTGKSKKVKGETKVSLEDKYDYKDYHVSWDGYSLRLIKGDRVVIKDNQIGLITDACFSKDGKYLITTNRQGEITLYNITEKKKVASMCLINNSDYITYTPDYYYTSSKNASMAIAFKDDGNILPLEQVELKFNRPDIVAERLGYASGKLVASYRSAYKKRLKRLGFTEDNLEGSYNLPTVKINYEKIPYVTKSQNFSLPIAADGNRQELKKIHVYVNDVPVFGSKGMDIGSESLQSWSETIDLQLSSGINEIKISAINKSGLESITESFEIKYVGAYYKPCLYLVTIGVSDYKQSNYNLTFASKDASDLINTLKNSSSFENVYHKALINDRATKANILDLKKFLSEANIDDVVLIFIAGHGVLDDEYNYYFATHEMDFSNPAGKGLPYEDLQEILDGIKSRNKALFMDTCHSGELDEDEIEDANSEVQQTGAVAFRSTGKLVKMKENSFGLENTLELSKTLFGDLKKGTGATVISAAGATEFALEGVNSSNGLFTSCILQGIETRRADLNRDRKYSITEIQQYVTEQVVRLSDGKQVPTSREENLKRDFTIY